MGRLFLLPVSLLALAGALKIASFASSLSLAPQAELGGVLVALGTLMLLSGWLDNPPSPHRRGSGLYALIPDVGLVGMILVVLGASFVQRWPIGVFAITLVGMAYVFYRQATLPAWARPDALNGWLGQGTPPSWAGYAFVLLPAWCVQLWLAARFGDPHAFFNDFSSPGRVIFFALHFGLILGAPLALRTDEARRRFTLGVWCDALLLGLVVCVARRFTWPVPFEEPNDGKVAFHAVWALRGALAFSDRWPKAKVLWVFWAFGVMLTCLQIKVTGMKDTVIGLAVFAGVEAYLGKWGQAPVKRWPVALLSSAFVVALLSWVRFA